MAFSAGHGCSRVGHHMGLRVIPLLLIDVMEVSLVILVAEGLDAAAVRIVDDHPGERLLQGVGLVLREGTW